MPKSLLYCVMLCKRYAGVGKS